MHQMPLQEFDPSHEDFFEQMISSLPPSSWPDLTPAIGVGAKSGDDDQLGLEHQLRQHQISGGNSGAASAMKSLLQQQLMGLAGGGMQFPGTGGGLSSMPRSLLNGSLFNSEADDSVQALYNVHVLGGSLQGPAQASHRYQHFQIPQDGAMQAQSVGTPVASGSTGGGSGAAAAQPRQRVRARRGQATDPHSIAERLRRERISERMKSLQELVPNANKTDKASMLDEIIDYVKFLQLQVKVLSMSRLGGAGAVNPLVADVSSERTTAGGDPTTTTLTDNNKKKNKADNVAVTEHQVAKLMEEDMGSAMQYLQGKGLCLMPISLATAISTATSRYPVTVTGGGSSSPSLSRLTVQSTTIANGNVVK